MNLCALLMMASLVAAPERTLVVSGDGFAFHVMEPAGWRGDTAAASEHDANIVFLPSGELAKSAEVTIRVRIDKKSDEHIASALAAKMADERKQCPDIQFAELMIDHPIYATYSKLFFVPRRSYEYVSLINPGQNVPYLFSVTMSVARRPANADERAALDLVARTLRFELTPARAQ